MKIQNILIVSIIIMSLFSISFVSSAGFDWRTFCNTFDACLSGAIADTFGRFDEGIQNTTISNGYFTDFNSLNNQPLVTSFNITGAFANFLVFPNGNFLQIYDKNLNLQQEVNTGGHALANIDIIKWDDIAGFEIAGIWEINSSDVVFKVYSYNVTSNLFGIVFEQNFTTSIREGYAGIRHSGGDAYFFIPKSNVGGLFQSDFIQINDSGIFNQQLINRSCFFDEPLAFTDVDFDGDIEYMTFCATEVIIFDETGTIEFNVSDFPSGVNFNIISDAKLVKADNTNQWKVAVYQGEAFVEFPNILHTNSFITMFRLDGSKLWQVADADEGVNQGRLATGTFFIVPNFIERWFFGQEAGLELAVFVAEHGLGNNFRFRVIEADDGQIKASKTFLNRPDWSTVTLDASLTIVDINNNGVQDFIFSQRDGYIIYDPEIDTILIEKAGTLGSFPTENEVFRSCIPADLQLDGQQELICSGKDITIVYFSSHVNDNAVIQSVSFDPSTTIQVNTSVTFFIFATDSESDTPLTYKHKCETGDVLANESQNPTRSCFYDTIGIHFITVAVSDPFHTNFNVFSQSPTPITVTVSGGSVCGDLICEAGETNFNCAIDCPLGNVSQSSLVGSIPLPTELVEIDNQNKGLLPEIYFGTIGFMSSVLSPTIVLVFLFFLVMIMITVGIIIKKIGQKIGKMSG